MKVLGKGEQREPQLPGEGPQRAGIFWQEEEVLVWTGLGQNQEVCPSELKLTAKHSVSIRAEAHSRGHLLH